MERSFPALGSTVLAGLSRCHCKRCEVLPNFEESECLCCREMGEKVATAAQPDDCCITEHPHFAILCLSIVVLRVAYLELRDNRHSMAEQIHKRYRYTAYRQFVRWLWGNLGHGERLALPSCVVAKVRATFPKCPPGGFKYPED